MAAPNETLIEMGEQERWGGLDADSELVGAFRWRDAKANRLAGTAQAGQFGAYDGSGFVLDVTNLTTSYLVESFEFLEENTWLDRQTRGIFMSVMLFNANFNTYAVLQFFLELSPAGVMVPTYNFQTVKMDMYYNTRDIPTMAFEGVLYLYMFIYICVEFQEIRDIFKATGSIRGYFQDFWNVLDWALIMFTYLALALRFIFFMDENVRNFNPYTKEVVEEVQAANAALGAAAARGEAAWALAPIEEVLVDATRRVPLGECGAGTLRWRVQPLSGPPRPSRLPFGPAPW